MGKWLHKHFVKQGIRPVIIDPDAGEVSGAARIIHGLAKLNSLRDAGIEKAAGIVAGTDSDHDNLSILMSVRALHPEAFAIVRQNSHDNQIAFDAANAELILQSSLTTARRILKNLISPQIQLLIDYLRKQGEEVTQQVVDRLKSTIGEKRTHLWRVNLCAQEADAVIEHLDNGSLLTLGELIRNPHHLSGSISCIALAIERGNKRFMLPADSETLLIGDEILFCGTELSESMLSATMNNEYKLEYLITDIDPPRGNVFSWLRAYLVTTESSPKLDNDAI